MSTERIVQIVVSITVILMFVVSYFIVREDDPVDLKSTDYTVVHTQLTEDETIFFQAPNYYKDYLWRCEKTKNLGYIFLNHLDHKLDSSKAVVTNDEAMTTVVYTCGE